MPQVILPLESVSTKHISTAHYYLFLYKYKYQNRYHLCVSDQNPLSVSNIIWYSMHNKNNHNFWSYLLYIEQHLWRMLSEKTYSGHVLSFSFLHFFFFFFRKKSDNNILAE